jgi:hypothetical protein
LPSVLLSKNIKIKIYRTLIFLFYMGVKHGLTLREEHRLRAFENRVLSRMFGPMRDEVREGWRKLHNEKLCRLYSSPDIIRVIMSRRMRWAGHVAYMVAVRSAYKILVGKPEGKRPLRRHRCRWEDNIKMDLGEVGFWGCRLGSTDSG